MVQISGFSNWVTEPRMGTVINFGKISKVIAALDGMFKKCFIEPALHGWSLFDVNGKFIAVITENGVALDFEYPHSEQIAIKLNNRGIMMFDYKTWQTVLLQDVIDEALLN